MFFEFHCLFYLPPLRFALNFLTQNVLKRNSESRCTEETVLGMRNTDQWLSSSKEPYLEHYSEEFLKEQWAALCDVVSTYVFNCNDTFLGSIKISAAVSRPIMSLQH